MAILTETSRAAGRYLNALSDVEFRAKAYADYLDECANSYLDLIAAAKLAADDGYDSEEAEIQQTVNQRVQSILDEYKMAGTESVAFKDGYTDLRTLLTGIMEVSDASCNLDSSTYTDCYNSGVQLYDINGTVQTTKITIAQIADELDETLQSTVATSSVMASSVFNNVSDRLAAFDNKMTTFFKNGYTVASQTVTHAKTLLSDAQLTCQEITTSVMDALGLDKIAEEDKPISNTDIVNYTGASPVGAMDFSSAKKAVATGAKLVAKAVASVAVSIWNKVVKPVFNWAKAKVTQIISNPYDVEVITAENSAFSIDGWLYQTKIANSEYWTGSRGYWGWAQHEIFNDANDSRPTRLKNGRKLKDQVILPMLNNWYKYKLLYGEVVMKMTKIYMYYAPLDETDDNFMDWRTPVDVTDNLKDDDWFGSNFNLITNMHVTFDAVLECKPYAVNRDVVKRSIAQAFNGATYWTLDASVTTLNCGAGDADKSAASEEFIARFEEAGALMQKDGNLYVDVQADNEKELYAAFADGKELLYRSFITATDIEAHARVGGIADKRVVNIVSTWADKNQTITNADWVSVVSGWNKDTANPVFNPLFNVADAARILLLIRGQRIQRVTNPLDYPFIPYQSNKSSFDTCRFRIRTDDENQSALTNFLTGVVVVVIVATVAISAATIVKKIQRAKYFKRASFVGELDNQMWNGGGSSLTRAQQRKYIKYSKKMQNCSLFGNSLATAASANTMDQISSMIQPNSNPDEIRALIIGH